jgi:hypothetical protein
MKYILLFTILLISSCVGNNIESNLKRNQMELKNEQMRDYEFLKLMFENDYFPNNVVGKGKEILVDLCFEIEAKSPKNLEELYKITNVATDKFNDLQQDFYNNGSEIETGAREIICEDFEKIAFAYGYKDADVEWLTGNREW